MTGFLSELAIRFHAGRRPVRCLLSFTDSRLRPARGPSLDHSGGGSRPARCLARRGRCKAQFGPFSGLRGLRQPAYAAPPGAVSASKIINTESLMTGAAETDLQRFLADHPEVRFFDAFVNDLNTVERGKRIDRANIAGVFKRGMPLPGSMFALDIEGGTVEDTGLGFADGDADRPCMPIPGTLVMVPWQTDGIAQLQLTMHEHDGSPFFGDPRHLLANVLAALHAPVAHAGGGDRIRVLSGGCRARCIRPAAAAERPAHGPAGIPHADQLDDGSQRVLAAARRDRSCVPTAERTRHVGARRIRPGAIRSEPRACAGRAAGLRRGAAIQTHRQERGACARLRGHVPAQALSRHGGQRPAHSRQPAGCRRAQYLRGGESARRARRCVT